MEVLSGTTGDYIGRTVDHVAFDDMQVGRDTLLSQQLVKEGQSGALITGIQKLAQRYLIELLTELGSLRYLPRRGTQFMIDARAGFWRTPADVQSSFSSSSLDLRTNLIGEESEDDPEDERFAGADLLSVALSAPDYVTMSVMLHSLAGTSRRVIFPIRINVVS
jgi:hypothetical protein